MKPKLKRLEDANDIIDKVLHGTARASESTGLSQQAISSWRARGVPPEWHYWVGGKCEAAGYDPDPTRLFSQKVGVE